MVQVNGEIVIERPLGEVFDFVANQVNEPSTDPGKMRIAKKTTEGRLASGQNRSTPR